MTHPFDTPFTVQPDTLAQELRSADAHRVLLDLRFVPGQDNGRARYLAGHLPGAVFVDLSRQLADPTLQGRGANPLPEVARLQQDLRAFGIHAHSRVVVYDDRTGAAAARAWWILRWAGLQDVRVLDGGLALWTQLGHPLVSGESPPAEAGTVAVRAGALQALEVDEVARSAAQGALIDARSRDFYDKGHLPGALSLPISELADASGRLRPAGEIHALLERLGVDRQAPIQAYCGGGVAGAFLVYALAESGLSAALYPGSWSEWSADPSRPVERTGAPA